MPTVKNNTQNTSYLAKNLFLTKLTASAAAQQATSKFFIPTVKIINGIQVPSTPFNFNDGMPLFLGDVITYTLSDEFETTEIYCVVEFYNGTYYAKGEQDFFDTPLCMFDETPMKVLGNSISNPELLNLLN